MASLAARDCARRSGPASLPWPERCGFAATPVWIEVWPPLSSSGDVWYRRVGGSGDWDVSTRWGSSRWTGSRLHAPAIAPTPRQHRLLAFRAWQGTDPALPGLVGRPADAKELTPGELACAPAPLEAAPIRREQSLLQRSQIEPATADLDLSVLLP